MAKRRKKSVIPGVSFSWKRALGVTKAKQKIARKTGIPTTKAGRQRKIGRILTGGGCILYVVAGLAIAASIALIII